MAVNTLTLLLLLDPIRETSLNLKIIPFSSTFIAKTLHIFLLLFEDYVMYQKRNIIVRYCY